MGGAAVERDLLDAAVSGQKDGAARRLIHAARLHADKAVLHQIEPADAVPPAQRIQLRESSAGDIFLPSIAIGSPRTNSTVT